MHQYRKKGQSVTPQSLKADIRLRDKVPNLTETHFDRFRLIDCGQLCKNRMLSIREMNGIPNDTDYVTVSYPMWVEPRPIAGPQIFSSADQYSAISLSTNLLFDLCSWVLKENVKYIWIERFCNDVHGNSASQMECLAKIFKSSTFCVVLPSGLRHWHSSMSTLGSPWMSDWWALMAVLAAPKTHVLVRKVDIDDESGQIELESCPIEEWLCDHHDLTTQRNWLLLLDALSWRDLSSQEKMSDEMLYFRNRTVWKCAFLRKPPWKGLRVIASMPFVLRDTRGYRHPFDKRVSDPQCNDVDVLAFRDAVSSTGPDMSRKWKSFINRMKLPTMTIPEVVSRSWRALPVRGYSMSV